MVELLIDRGAKVDARDAAGRSERRGTEALIWPDAGNFTRKRRFLALLREIW
jgi:hypothetical protein